LPSRNRCYHLLSILQIDDNNNLGNSGHWGRSQESAKTKVVMMNARENRMGRKKINSEATAARFRAGTLAQIDAVLDAGEKRADFFRDTVEAEIKRRERKKRARRKT
jgi:hypothetical protein